MQTWQDAEALAVQLLVHLGYPDARLTPSGPDAGVDAVARGAVAQAKYEQASTGAPVVQALVGVASVEGAQAVFLSLAGYTAQALAFAERAQVALYTYTKSGTVTAVSSTARRRLQQAQERQADPIALRRLQRDRRSAEKASQRVDSLLQKIQWLAQVVARQQQIDRSRSGQRAQKKALKLLDKAIMDLDRTNEKRLGWDLRMHLRGVEQTVKQASKALGVRIPRD